MSFTAYDVTLRDEEGEYLGSSTFHTGCDAYAVAVRSLERMVDLDQRHRVSRIEIGSVNGETCRTLTYWVRDGEVLHYRRMPESPDKPVDDVQHLVGLGMRKRLAEGLARLINRLDLEGDSYDD